MAVKVHGVLSHSKCAAVSRFLVENWGEVPWNLNAATSYNNLTLINWFSCHKPLKYRLRKIVFRDFGRVIAESTVCLSVCLSHMLIDGLQPVRVLRRISRIPAIRLYFTFFFALALTVQEVQRRRLTQLCGCGRQMSRYLSTVMIQRSWLTPWCFMFL